MKNTHCFFFSFLSNEIFDVSYCKCARSGIVESVNSMASIIQEKTKNLSAQNLENRMVCDWNLSHVGSLMPILRDFSNKYQHGDVALGIRNHRTPFTIFNFSKNRSTDIKSRVIERLCNQEEWQNIGVNEALSAPIGEN